MLALDRLDLDVPAGSVFGLLGPNGAGKTTTLLVTGLARPTGGAVTIDGRPLGATAAAAASIGVLDQEPRSTAGCPAGGSSSSPGACRVSRGGGAGAGGRDARAGGLAPRRGEGRRLLGRPCASGSGSPRRSWRGPGLLVLDEPVAPLDPEGRRDLLALIAELRADATVIFFTHVLADIERVCDRVGILDHGRLVTEGRLTTCWRSTRCRSTGSSPTQARLWRSPGWWPRCAPRRRSSGSTTAARRGDDRIVVSMADEAAAAAGLLPLVAGAGCG